MMVAQGKRETSAALGKPPPQISSPSPIRWERAGVRVLPIRVILSSAVSCSGWLAKGVLTLAIAGV